ncbi:MAG: hypothetical protein EOP10_30760 [Proteobacteria bacterium]|nr:MAG: hypothetical protein EOP10_30760 [Pseudomonadota bacterium]
MKFSNIVLLASVISAPAFAKGKVAAFVCPEESVFIENWTSQVEAAAPEDDSALAAERKLAYDSFFPRFIPNHDLLFNTVTIGDKDYDLTLVKGNFYFHQEFPDAYAVVFEKGTSRAVGTIQTDTDRADYNCEAFAPGKSATR